MFDWDTNNLRKIRAHRIKAEEVEKALSNDPIPIYEQDVEGDGRGCWPDWKRTYSSRVDSERSFSAMSPV